MSVLIITKHLCTGCQEEVLDQSHVDTVVSVSSPLNLGDSPFDRSDLGENPDVILPTDQITVHMLENNVQIMGLDFYVKGAEEVQLYFVREDGTTTVSAQVTTCN